MIARVWRGCKNSGLKAVAGEDYERAVIPEERRKYLQRFEEKAAHFEVVAER